MITASTYILATVWKVIFGTVGNFEMNAQSLLHPAMTGDHCGRSAASQLHTVCSEGCIYLFKIKNRINVLSEQGCK